MTEELTKWLVQQGAVAVLAAVIFWFYRRDVRSFTKLWQTQTELLVTVVRDNTHAQVELKAMVRSLHHRLDNGEIGVRPEAWRREGTSR